MDIKSYIPEDLLEKYEFHNYNHALEIITQAFPEEWNELVTCLRKLNISVSDLQAAGGNETNIPKKFDDVLYPFGWREIRISGDLHIKFFPRQADQRGRFSNEPFEERVIEQYIEMCIRDREGGEKGLVSRVLEEMVATTLSTISVAAAPSSTPSVVPSVMLISL